MAVLCSEVLVGEADQVTSTHEVTRTNLSIYFVLLHMILKQMLNYMILIEM